MPAVIVLYETHVDCFFRFLLQSLAISLSSSFVTQMVRIAKRTLFPNGYTAIPPPDPTPEEQAAMRERLLRWRPTGPLGVSCLFTVFDAIYQPSFLQSPFDTFCPWPPTRRYAGRGTRAVVECTLQCASRSVDLGSVNSFFVPGVGDQSTQHIMHDWWL